MSDIDVNMLVGAAEEADQNDLAVAMRDIEAAVAENWPDDEAVDAAMDEVTLPFHDVERELAFTLGVTFGAWLEEEYPETEAEQTEDAQTVDRVQG